MRHGCFHTRLHESACDVEKDGRFERGRRGWRGRRSGGGKFIEEESQGGRERERENFILLFNINAVGKEREHRKKDTHLREYSQSFIVSLRSV